jgi:hypothetical protein
LKGSDIVVDYHFVDGPSFVGWVGGSLLFATGTVGSVFCVVEGTAKHLFEAGAVVTDVIAGPSTGTFVATTATGVVSFDENCAELAKLTSRIAPIGPELCGHEVCIAGQDRSVYFVDLATKAEREIRTESGRHARRGSLRTAIDHFYYLAAEQLCLSAHGSFLRLWDPRSGAIAASYFAESDIMCVTPHLIGSTMACGTGIGQLHFLVFHRAAASGQAQTAN